MSDAEVIFWMIWPMIVVGCHDSIKSTTELFMRHGETWWSFTKDVVRILRNR